MPTLAFPTGDGLPLQYDQTLVVLSFLIAWFASFTALDIGGRINATAGLAKAAWLTCGAIAMGGGIFSMHFIAMLAASLDLPLNYAADLTALSFFFAVAFTGLGFYLVSRAPSKLSTTVFSGVLMGLGVAVMHYTGMAAVEISASISYHPILFLLSIVIAIVAASAALWLAFNLEVVWQKAAAAVVMAVAVCGMHYTAMAAATFRPDAALPMPAMSLSPALLAISVAVGASVIIGLSLVSTVVDRRLTDMARREADAIRESEERLRTISAALPISIILAPLDGGKVVYGNRRSRNLIAAPGDDESRWEPIRERFVDRAAFDELFGLIRERGEVENFEIQMRRYDGTTLWAMFSAERIKYHGEDMVVCGFYDVTDRKEAESRLVDSEEMLRETNAQLQMALRNSEDHARGLEAALKRVRETDRATRAKSAFLAMMSHEIRTPMNVIIGYLELLSETKLSHHQYRTVNTVRQSAFSLLRIIDDVLDFSKIEAGKLDIEYTAFDLIDLVESVAEIVAPSAWSKSLNLLLDCDPQLPDQVIGDPIRIRQVLNNLTSNAVKFTETGQILIRAKSVSRANSHVRFRVSVVDTGIGIKKEDQPQLFEPFSQAEESTSRRFGGTGLGLSISKQLVELMGGRIGINSTFGEGSEFWFEFDLEVASSAAQPAPRFQKIDGLRAVVATADGKEAAIIRQYLGACKVPVVEASDVKEATRLARSEESNGAQTVVILGEELLNGDADNVVEAVRHPADGSAAGVVVLVRDLTDSADLADRRPREFVYAGRPVRPRALKDAVLVSVGRGSPTVRPLNANESHLRIGGRVPTRAEAVAQNSLILVAEDHPTNREVIAQQLKLLGFACDVAADGEKAWNMVMTGDYAAVLTDCHMPNMDGFELTDRIRNESEEPVRSVPIIAITANALLGEVDRCLAAGMSDYMAKPVSLATLRDTIRRWLPAAAYPTAATRPAIAAEKAGHASGEALIDVDVLEDLVGDDPGAIAEVLKSFVANLPRNRDELLAAHATGPESLDQAAHKLAGAAKTAGAVTLWKCLDRLQSALGEDDAGNIDLLLDQVADAIQRTEAAILDQFGDVS